MKYIYNAERDRIAIKAGNTSFFQSVFEENDTGEKRALFLHAVTDLKRHRESIAEKYMNEGESLIEIKSVPRKIYERWLCGENDYINIEDNQIPISFITDFLIANDGPKGIKTSEGLSPKIGDLSIERELLKNMDVNLYQSIVESFEKTKEKYDIVREAPEVENDPLYDAYNRS